MHMTTRATAAGVSALALCLGLVAWGSYAWGGQAREQQLAASMADQFDRQVAAAQQPQLATLTGAVASVRGSVLTLTLPDGSTRDVSLNAGTGYQQVVMRSADALAAGQRVTVRALVEGSTTQALTVLMPPATP